MNTELTASVDHSREPARPRAQVKMLLALLSSLAVGALAVAFPPGWLALFVCAGVAFSVMTWCRPVWGVAAVLGATLLFEQYDFAYFQPVTRTVPFYESISGFMVNPLELLLALVAGVVLVQVALRGREVNENRLAAPVAVFALALVLWLLYGLVQGGDPKAALWELRALAYFCLLVFVVPQAIARGSDVRLLLWVAIVAVSIKAVQGVWNCAVVLHGDVSAVRSVTGHEDALFMAWMAVLLVGLLVYRVAPRQRIALLAATPIMAAAFVVTDRRAAYAALAVGLAILGALVTTDRDKRVLVVKCGLPALFLVICVIAIGWNDSGVLGGPARTVESIVAPTAQVDVDSSLYREVEESNLMHAVSSNPVLGLGFGRPFQSTGQSGIVYVGYGFENTIAHNEVLWIWANMGTVGFALFWVMIGGVIASGAVVFREAIRPYTKAVAALVTCAVAMQVVVSYVDLQLTYARNMVFLGVLVGVLARLRALEQKEEEDGAVV